jgi:hypothetical protein
MVGFINTAITTTLNYNHLRQVTICDCLRLDLFLPGLRASSLLLWLTWFWFKIGQFFSFRCPLSDISRLNTQSRLNHFSFTAVLRNLLRVSEWVSELYYDRRSVGQSILVSSPHLGLMTIFLLLSDHCGFLIWGALSDKRTGLSFTMCNLQYILLSHIWDSPNLEDQVPVFISPKEQGGPVIPPGTGFFLRMNIVSFYNFARTGNRTLLWRVRLLYCAYLLSQERVLIPGQPTRCVGNMFSEALPSNGLFRLSGFLTHSLSWNRA